MPDFLTQRFLGVCLEVSDDRTLTNLTLKRGYRTVYQSTSLVYTDCPTQLKKMAKQQYRWARGSQYNTLRMFPWMLTQAPVLAFFFAVDIAIPFLWICSAIGWGVRSATGYHADLYGGILSGRRPFELPVMLCLIVVSSWVSMSLRQQRHLEQCPADIFFIPLYVVFSTCFLLPIRLYGFLRMAKPAGWGTRVPMPMPAATVEPQSSATTNLWGLRWDHPAVRHPLPSRPRLSTCSSVGRQLAGSISTRSSLSLCFYSSPSEECSMTRGRGSTYVSVVGGLSLTVVALSLYLSPLGAATRHAKVADTAGTRASELVSGSGDLPHVHEHSTKKSVAAPAAKSGAKVVGSRPVVRQIVYVPTPGSASGKSSTSTSTSVPQNQTTTTTTRPVGETFTVENKANLVAPSSDFWGVSINGVPQGMPQLRALDSEVGSAPSELTWYQGWDQPFPSQAVQNAWENGALPMITWESKPTIDSTPAQSDPAYSLSDIINGNYDSYLQTFAQAVVAQGMPVVIRLDQEMNGNWFPWSEGVNGNTSGQFVQMWQHVWNIFQSAGANRYAIWLWAPNRVDNLAHVPSLSELYPGDAYVDWVGIDAYWRYATEPPTFASVLGRSIAAVNAVTTKPIYIAETAGIETDPTDGNDLGSQKVQYTTNLLTGIESDPQIVGFSWFDNVAASDSDGTPVINDWRVDSDAANLIAFKSGLAAGPFAGGLMPSSGSPATLTVVPPSGS